MVNEWLKTGLVKHARLRPFKHSFAYSIFYLKFPLSQIEQLKSTFFSLNRFNLFSLYSSDYLDGSQRPLREKIKDVLNAEGIFDVGEIDLQTFPRILGHVFNPVSFWHASDVKGKPLAVLAEVNNTFGDRHCYLINIADGKLKYRLLKEFHVSPFFEIKGEYHFSFHSKSTTINYYDSIESHYLFTSSLNEVKSYKFSTANLLKLFFQFPAMNVLVMVRIHWQALRLYLKKATFYTRPQPPRHGITKERT